MQFRTALLDRFQDVNTAAERKVGALQEIGKFLEGVVEVHRSTGAAIERLAAKAPATLTGSDETTVSQLWGAVLKWAEARVRSADDTTQEVRRLRDAMETLAAGAEAARKRLAADGQRLERRLADSTHQLSKAREKYHKAVRDAEAAEAALEAERRKPGAKQAAVDQADRRATRLAQEATQAESAYRAQIRATNGVQAEFYGVAMPEVLEEYRAMFATRLAKIKECFAGFVAAMWTAQEMVSPQIKVLEMAVARVSEDADIEEFTRRHRTNFQAPKPFEFEPEPSAAPIIIEPTIIRHKLPTTPKGSRKDGSGTTSALPPPPPQVVVDDIPPPPPPPPPSLAT
jgi:hypothetical protein